MAGKATIMIVGPGRRFATINIVATPKVTTTHGVMTMIVITIVINRALPFEMPAMYSKRRSTKLRLSFSHPWLIHQWRGGSSRLTKQPGSLLQPRHQHRNRAIRIRLDHQWLPEGHIERRIQPHTELRIR